jgi:hypothetical protein
MKLILRPDLRCPHRGCTAAVLEYRDDTDRPEYRCKMHGPVRPAARGAVTHRYPEPVPVRITTPPPDDAPAPYRLTPGERP